MENLKISGKHLEALILSLCIKDVSFFLKIKSYLSTKNSSEKSYFSDSKNQQIFNLVSKAFDKIEKIPTKSTMVHLVDKIEKDEEVKLYLNSIVENIYEEKELDKKIIESETLNFIMENRAYEAMLGAKEDIDNRNYGGVLKRFEDAIKIQFDKDLGVSIKDIDSCMEKMKTMDEGMVIPTGLGTLDRILGGGLHPKELTVFAGVPGGGKTLFLGNVAINAFAEGKKVLVYSFETSQERLLMRYYSNISM
jgi:replicative DNA helicase